MEVAGSNPAAPTNQISNLSQNRIGRVLFYIDAKGRMVLLHGFIKKTQKTPTADLDLARKNKGLHERELQKGK